MAIIADHPTHTITSNPKARGGWALLRYSIFAVIAIAAALIYFAPGGLEVAQLDPSELVAP